jgi:hypothetical protein
MSESASPIYNRRASLAALAPARHRPAALCAAALALVLALILTAAAHAAAPAPRLTVHSMPHPSVFSEANNSRCEAEINERPVRACDTYQLTVTNLGSLKTDGSAFTIKDTLPAGVEARAILLSRIAPVTPTVPFPPTPTEFRPNACSLVTVSCKFKSETVEGTPRPGTLKPDETVEMEVYVTVKAGASSGPLTNSVSVTGGGSAETKATSVNQLAAEETIAFGATLGAEITALDGTPETQAGGHPYELNTRFDLNSEIHPSPESQIIANSSEDLKDAIIDLPLGFVGSATAAQTCTFAQLVSLVGCSPASAVGHIYTEPESLGAAISVVYNMLPEHGVAAEFGFTDILNNTHAIYAKVVPTPAGYVLRASTREVPQIALSDIFASFFGNPAAKDGTSGPQSAFFTTPSDCSSGRPLTTTLYSDSWQKPGHFDSEGNPDLSDPNWKTSTSEAPPVTNCEALKGLFQPTITATPSNTRADSPTGLDVDIKVPQDQNPETLAVPPLKKAVVALPAGMTVNASSANGLQACSLEQVGVSAAGVPNAAEPTCPDASKIGTVELETPALASEVCKEATKNLAECPGEAEREKAPLEGSIYLAKQGENPFNSLLAIYIVINDARTGVLVKLAGKVEADPNNGQLTAVVDNNPQFPFSELRTHFFAGNTASLATPETCGSYAVSSELTPWSAPQSGPAATISSSFAVSQGADGGACTNRFAPTFTTGSSSTQAGAFSAFSTSFSRTDSDQNLAGISVTTPPGLLGVLKSVTQCPEPQASQGNCGPDSLIGESTVAVGTGPTPYWVTGGKVYLTGTYNNGPFGLSIVTPTVAGPFTLTGNGGPGREIVRASIRVDPTTSQITVLSDPLPRILEGIPLQIRTVNVTINRPGFIFNPTSCNPLSSAASTSSTQGASATAQAPFQATGCKDLAFKPSFAATTNAKTSKANGASLKVALSYPTTGPAQADIARVDLEIPKILPTRLTTIQRACTEAQFNANPATCPKESAIASATVDTPLLKNPLQGPVYFVSHGNAAFPDVEMVLQGEGITLVLDGKTQIKNGATFSHFETVPDAPFTNFEFSAPPGPFSIFTANGDVCAAPIKIPVKLTAQNGAVLSLTDQVAVEGCSSALKITSHKVSRRTITLKVTVPAAGRLTATGKGLSKAQKSARGRETITLSLKAKGKKKLNAKVKLSFVPSAKGGKALSSSVGVRVAKAKAAKKH